MTSIILIFALCLDRLLGEPRKYHPLVGFGNLANFVEKKFNNSPSKPQSIISGLFGLIVLVVPFVLASAIITQYQSNYHIIEIIILYWAIGHQSLRQHINVVKKHLIKSNISEAQKSLSMIVSRQTNELNDIQITQATIETGLENGSDAIFAPIFWFALLGAPAVVAYRLCNTLDAMWGYRNDRFNYFGRCAARCDDALNYIPARLVALSYAVFGNTYNALECWKNQSSELNSPNAGPVMASGAGSLNVLLGGPAVYHGTLMQKPKFGSGHKPETHDIDRSLVLILNTLLFWCIVITCIDLVILTL